MTEGSEQSTAPGNVRERATGPASPAKLMVPRWIQLIAVPLLVLGLWAAALAAGPVLLLFAIAGVLGLILDPVVRLIQRAYVPRGLAVALVYVGFWATVVGGGILLATPIGNQIEVFQENLPDYIDRAEEGLGDLQGWLDDRGIDLQIQAEGEDALSGLEQDLLQRSEDVVGFARDLLELVVAGLFALVLIIVISVYMLLYAHPIGDLARRVMPPSDGTRGDDFPTRVVHAVAGYVRGQLLFSLIMGASAALALWVFGTLGIFEEGRTYAGFFGVFYGLMELIPYIGPVLGAAPPVLIALVQDPLVAVWLVLLFVTLQQLEGHVVAPLVFSRALRINPLLVIFALLFGAHLYGVIGALVALPLAAMLRETVVYLLEHLRLEPWPLAVAEGPSASLLGAVPGSSCSACGARLPAGDRHCRNCGELLGPPPPPVRRGRGQTSRSAKAAAWKRASTVILIGGMIGLTVGRLLDRRRR
jgi:predicted PurR-regulated permease PerM